NRLARQGRGDALCGQIAARLSGRAANTAITGRCAMTDGALSASAGDNPGKLLRLERERRGLTIAQVAGELHMDSGVTRALEAGDFASLGAPIFVKGHLRNYAKLLGMDGEKIVHAYEASATLET